MSQATSIAYKMGLDSDGEYLDAYRGGIAFTTFLGLAGGTIGANRIVKPSGTTVVVGTLQSRDCIGVNASGAVVVTDPVRAKVGRVQVVSASPIAAGDRIKCAVAGRVLAFIDADLASSVVVNDQAGIEFTNQPANDGLEIGSDSASDVGTVTVIGTTNGADTVVAETITLTGVTFVSTTKVDWGLILAVKAEAHVGTITVREASGNAAVKTLAAGTNSAGVVDVGGAGFGGIAPVIVAGGASTKQIGMYGKNSAGVMAYDSQALNGTNNVTMNVAFEYVDELYVGDLAAASTIDLMRGAEEDENNKIGYALEAATDEDQTIWAVILGL